MPLPRVLHLISPTGYFGAEGWVIAQSRHLDPARVEVHLAATREGGDPRPEILNRAADRGIPTHEIRLDHRFDPAAPRKVAELARSLHISILHSHGYKSDVLAVMARRLCDARVVSTPHGFEKAHGLKMRAYEQMGNWALRRCESVAPLSRELQEQVLQRGVQPERIRFIENGVDLSEVDAELESGGPLPSDPPPCLVYVGRLARIKNVHGMIRAFDRLRRRIPEARLRIIGEGEEMEALLELSRELGLEGSVEFTGYRHDRLALLRECAIFCMCSHFEGIPRSMMEAMGMGLPAVAYEIPGTARLIEDGRTGRLVPLEAVEPLVDAWESLLRDGRLRREMGIRARERVHDHFSADRVGREYMDLYDELVADR